MAGSHNPMTPVGERRIPLILPVYHGVVSRWLDGLGLSADEVEDLSELASRNWREAADKFRYDHFLVKLNRQAETFPNAGAFAAWLGTDPSHVSKVLSGKRRLGPDKLLAVWQKWPDLFAGLESFAQEREATAAAEIEVAAALRLSPRLSLTGSLVEFQRLMYQKPGWLGTGGDRDGCTAAILAELAERPNQVAVEVVEVSLLRQLDEEWGRVFVLTDNALAVAPPGGSVGQSGRQPAR